MSAALRQKSEEVARRPEHAAFRKLLTEVLRIVDARQNFSRSIESDVLHRLALLKFITAGAGEPIFEHRWWSARNGSASRGELFEHSEQAHVMRSKIADIQADRKNIFRQVGETLCRSLAGSGRGNALEIAAGALWRRLSRDLRSAAEPLSIRGRRQRRTSFPGALRAAGKFHERPGPLRRVRRSAARFRARYRAGR